MRTSGIVIWLGLGVSACQQSAERATWLAGLRAAAASRKVSSGQRAAPAEPAPATPPPAPDSVQAVTPFVPKGYQVLYTLAGDLNRDAWPDRVVVLDTTAVVTDSMANDEREPIQRMKRPLLLLLGQPGGHGYTLAARNAHVVLCADCNGAMGGDPFQQVVIKRGYFSVEHLTGSAWRGLTIHTFRYNAADRHWYLHRIGGNSFHVLNPDSTTETKPQTARDFGRVRFEAYKGEE